MSDHDAAQGPIDKAYAQAEAMLDDEAARAARRARVLGAVAREVGTAPTVSALPKRPVSWAGGWLAAASVAGVSTLVAFQLAGPPGMQRSSPAAETPVAAAPAPAPSPTTAPAVDAVAPAPPAGPRARMTPQADVAAPPPLALPAPPSQTTGAPTAAPAPAAPQAPADSEALIVTGEAAPPPSAARAARAESSMAQAPASPAVVAARLHAAAAAGRLADLTALLAQGTAVDAPDREGETALMKSILANHPAAAALLRRYGASLERTNRAGVSAREMAASIDDPELNRALGLAP